MAARLDELRTIYEVDRLTLEKDKAVLQQELHRNYLYLALAGCGMLLLTLALWMVYSRRLNAKNRDLVARILEQDRAQGKKALPLPGDTKPGSPLLEALRRLMAEPAVFTDPSFNRKMLAEKLRTGETALQETVARYFSCGVTEFITEQRLNYSRKLLAQQGEKYTIEAIAVNSGFGSHRTFYRQFSQRYGVSPGEYRTFLRMVETAENPQKPPNTGA
jgi:AraC-like DNA-binding protein